MARACICVSNCSSTRSAVRRSASSRSAVRLAGEKKCSSARSACCGDVDLALLEALDQVVRRQIDQLDGVGAIENGIRHGLAHSDVRNLRDDVVQALDVLDVDCGVDVDAVLQQLFNVEIAFGMTATGRIGVGEFVDQHDLRAAGDDGVEVHFLEPLALVFDSSPRDDFETLQKRLGLFPTVRFHDPHDDVIAVLLAGAGRFEHRVGLADARRRAHEDSELAEAAFLTSRRLQQGFRRGSLIRIASLICHHASGVWPRPDAPSGRRHAVQCHVQRQHVHARLAEDAERRPSTCWLTSWRTRSSGILRAFATRGTWNSAASGEMWGSSPLPEAVTRSVGTRAFGFSFLRFSTSSFTRSMRALLVGPRFEPLRVGRVVGLVDRLGRILRIGLAGRRRPAVEIPIAGEVLAHHLGTDHLAVPLREAAVGLVRKDHLSDAGHEPADRSGR